MNTINRRKSEYRIRINRARRKRQLQRRLGMLVMTVILVACSSILLFSFRSKAQNNNEEISYKYYKSITVENGDTLWDIAEEYCDEHYKDNQSYINEVMHMNALREEKITAGLNIIIPYYSQEFVG